DATGDRKGYDGTTDSAAAPTVVGTVYGPDTVTGLDQVFDSRNAGARTLSVSAYTVNDGNGGGNYAVTTHTAQGTIAAKQLTGSITAADKVYDGTTTATIASRSLTGVVGSDDVSPTGGTASFSDATVGTGKTVTLTGAVLSGTDAGNYVLDAVSTTTANITPLVDTTAPATPPAPQLVGGTNNVTNDHTPSFSGTAEPNS